MTDSKLGTRTETRLAAVKALYAYEIYESLEDKKKPSELALNIINYYHDSEEDDQHRKIDEGFLNKLVQGVCENIEEIDAKIISHLGDKWNIKRLGYVMRSILRVASFELMNFSDTPYKIIVSEFVDITGMFLDEKEVGFINGILDVIAQEVRGDE